MGRSFAQTFFTCSACLIFYAIFSSVFMLIDHIKGFSRSLIVLNGIAVLMYAYVVIPIHNSGLIYNDP